MRRRLLRTAALAATAATWPALALPGCSGDDASQQGAFDTEDPPPALLPPTAPAGEPPVVDPAYAVDGSRRWYLIGDGLTAGHPRLELQVAAPAETRFVDLWLDGGPGVRLDKNEEGFSASVDLAPLSAGEHEVLLGADGSAMAFARLTFVRTHPYYLSVTNDWDDPDNGDDTLRRQEQLRALHPALKLTHFVGPYTFTDPTVAPSRVQYLSDWVRGMRDQHGDEIGLHIHPYCSFVEAAGLTCKTEPSFAYATGDTTGYTVILSTYDEPQMETLLETAVDLFESHGLGRPTSFRAGGWTAELHTLHALATAGFAADGSAANWHLLTSWRDVPWASLFGWCQEHWTTIDRYSQPYYPSEADILEPGTPFVPVLEVPDNGLLVDYATAADMIDVFDANWSGGALDAPKIWSVGYHPPNFSDAYLERMDGALSHADQFLAADDNGPAVYANMSDLAIVWPVPPR